MNGAIGTGLRGDTEFLRRTNNRQISKQRKIRTIRLQGLHILLICIVLITAALAAYKIATFILNWEKLNVKSIVLVNKPRYNLPKLMDTLRQFQGNILTLDFDHMRDTILAFKEIKEVQLSRQLPSTIEIYFILREPVFQVAINGKYNIMDMDGIILYSSEQSCEGLINISDIQDNELENLSPYLPELSRIKDYLDYVGYKKPYGIILKLKGKKEIFYPGESDFARKINDYLEIREDPAVKMYDIRCVDLRFKDRFYFEYETEGNN